jgi:hypothetical protein
MGRHHYPEREERAALYVEVLRRATEDSTHTRGSDRYRTDRPADVVEAWQRVVLSPPRRDDRRSPRPSPEAIFFA